MQPYPRALVLVMCIVLGACSGGDAPPAAAAAVSSNAAAVAVTPPATVPPASTAPVITTPTVTPAAAAAGAPGEAAVPGAAPPATSALPNADVQCANAATAAEQCQVDKNTYIGWRTFAGQCQVCHGGSALGSTFAPNLLDRFHQRVDHARFVEVVTNGYRGQVGVMPAWKGNPNVMPHVDQIYRYLKARADGVLPPGRPARRP